MLLPENVGALLPAVAKTKENVYQLTSLYVEDDYVYASDGICIYRAPTEHAGLLEDYPDDGQPYTKLTTPALIPGALVAKALKNAPKNPPQIILKRVVVEDGKLTTTDLDSWDVIKFKSLENTLYPSVKTLFKMAQGDDTSTTFALSRGNLETLLKVMKAAKSDTVQITVDKPNDPIEVKINDEIDGIIMPINLNM